LSAYRQEFPARLSEGVIILALFSAFVHLTTSKSLSYHTLSVSAGMVLAAAGLCFRRVSRKQDSDLSLWIILTALAGGFWTFNFFRFMKLVVWPLNHADDLTGYVKLFYFHIVLSASVLTPVFIAYQTAAPTHNVSWDRWKNEFFSIPVKTALWVGLFGIWSWALYEVLSAKPSASGPVIAFAVISISKATLTGATEEICYRGLIQPTAIERFGTPMGILFQSCLYTAFHMHLGAAFFSHAIFLGSVMALGLVFGIITHLSGGIGWVFAVHTALNLVIEWHNLS
jgi:membrane protease YdiL (CAAX protease family)